MSEQDVKNELVNVGKIKKILDGRGMPYAEFGRRIGINNRESISRRLLNKHKVSGDELFKIADELGVPVDELRVVV